MYFVLYIVNKDGVKFIKGIEWMMLWLYEYVGIYFIDFIYVDFLGSKVKVWWYFIVSIWDYSNGCKWFVYFNLLFNYVYVESCNEDLVWDIDEC